ncbi:MAG TPA: potassium transporter TrkG [Candidatus Limnocylindrales bacterium]|nr:potassium transporter TrkG [Candidatus Limnocylindrales bacterium]
MVLIVSFAALTAAGTAMLALPVATTAGQHTTLLDALFTSTSAVSTTGLVLFDTATHWSGFGQVVILVLMQLGGFAFMTGSTLFLLVLVGRRTSLRDRLRVQAAGGVLQLGSVTDLVRRVALFTLACEAVGAGVLAVAFVLDGTDIPTAAWWGVFHTVSAFNNAGFDLFGGLRSLTGYADAPSVLVPLGSLIVLGGLGFAIVGDVIVKRRWTLLALETKLVVSGTLLLIAVGALGTAGLEWRNPGTLGPMQPTDKVINALFHSVSLRSAGFDSLHVGELLDESLLLAIGLMFVGGASGSTAGGVKVNTVAIAIVAAWSGVRSGASPAAFGRRIPEVIVYRAMAILIVAVLGAFALALALQLTGSQPFLDVLFEGVSALGTVGVSTGLTSDFSPAGQVMLTVAMFVGRLGPLALVLALAQRTRPTTNRPAVEPVRIG